MSKSERYNLTASVLTSKPNESCDFFRLHCVKRITNRKKRDVDLLKTRLDVYNDEWRTAQPDPITKVKMPTNLTPTGKVRKTRAKKNNGLAQNSPQQPADQPTKPVETKLTKRKRVKAEKVNIQP